MNSKKLFIKIGSQKLNPVGYEYFEYPPSQGVGVYFFRKHLGEDIYAFVEIQKLSFVRFIVDGEEQPRRFIVALSKNIGNVPRRGFKKEEKNLENWLYFPLSNLLWSVLGLKIYEDSTHFWKYHNEEELVSELDDAFNMVIKYGIPWVEDPNSKNPY